MLRSAVMFNGNEYAQTSAPCMRGSKGEGSYLASASDVHPVHAGGEGFLGHGRICSRRPPRARGGRRFSARALAVRRVSAPCLRGSKVLVETSRPNGDGIPAHAGGGESCNGDNVLDGCEQHVMHLAQGLHLRESLLFCLDARNWNTFNRYGINWRRRR